MAEPAAATRYVGFWMRVIASVVDILVFSAVIALLLYWVYGSSYFSSSLDAVLGSLGGPQSGGPSRPMFAGPADFLINVVLPTVALILLWRYRGATPGKMLISARIVDAGTGKDPSTWQFVIRFVAMVVSLLLLGIPFLWVAFDARKQGVHDKLARTAVVYDRR